jgi:peptidoglycan/LPS O-acetylase OafA/YrhL
MSQVPRWVVLPFLLALEVVGLIYSNPYLIYLPIFGLGGSLAIQEPEKEAGMGVPSNTKRMTRFGLILGLCAISSLSVKWCLSSIKYDKFELTFFGMATIAGCVLLTRLALRPGWLSQLLAGRAFRFLGRISFSLYLVHEPITINLYRVLKGEPTFIPVNIFCSIATAIIFYFSVEKPAHSFSRRSYMVVRSWISAR